MVLFGGIMNKTIRYILIIIGFIIGFMGFLTGVSNSSNYGPTDPSAIVLFGLLFVIVGMSKEI